MLLPLTVAAHSPQAIPLVENRGQWPAHVLFGADVEHGKWFVGKHGITVHQFDLSAISRVHQGEAPVIGDTRIRGHVYQVEFEGASNTSMVERENSLPTTFNYFLGNDASQWAGNCASYATVKIRDLYPNTDLKVYSNASFLKYDFVVHAGGNPSRIVMNYSGQDDLSIEDGRLKVRTSVGEVWEQKPIAWQIIKGEKTYIACEFALNANSVSFHFPNGFRPDAELTIDPELIFSTYSGSFSDNFGYTATYDSEGYLYSGSSAFGQGYPTSIGAYQTVWGGGDGSFGLPGTDIALSKYDVSGTFMVWSTFLGGLNDELPHSLICNAEDELIVYGTTSSPNFPTTVGAYDPIFNGGTPFAPSGVGTDYVNGSDIIVTRLNGNGSALVGSTFLGGTSNDGVNTATILKFNYADEFRGEIDLDDDGNVYIATCTYSPNFPISGGFQPTLGGALDACLVKLNGDLSNLIWSTFIGGINDDSGYSATLDSQGNVYVCGGTKSQNFPMTPGALFPTNQGGSADGFIVHISANGQTLLNSTYFGSASYDQLYFVETDAENAVHVFGQSLAPASTWVINAAWSQPNSGMVVAKLNPSLSQIVWSTVFGSGDGEPNLSPAAFTVDVCGKIYLSGWGGSVNTGSNSQTDDVNGMFVTPGAFQTTTTGSDFYLLVLEDDASGVVYASYYGGPTSAEHVDGGTSRFDRKGIIYQSVCAGCGSNDDFPIVPPNAHSPFNNSNNCNDGVFKFDFQLPLTVADFTAPPIGCVNAPILFTSTSIYAQGFFWDFGDDQTSVVPNPTHIFSEPGDYLVTLIVTHPGTCNATDTLSKLITIGDSQVISLDDIVVCDQEQPILGPPDPDPSFTYLWTPTDFLSNQNVANPVFTPGTSTSYILIAEHGGCIDTLFQFVEVVQLSLSVPNDTTLCDDASIILLAEFEPFNGFITWSDVANFSNVLNDSPQDPDILVNPTQPTIYYIQLVYLGCVLTDQVSVNLVSAQTEIQGDFTTCIGDTIALFVLDPSPWFDYNWQPENLILTGQSTSSITAVINEETTFTVNSVTTDGCTGSDVATVTVSEINADLILASANPEIIVQGQSSQLNVQPSGYEYTWIPPATLNNAGIANPTARPAETTTYFVTIADGDCIFGAQVTVRVVDFVCGPPSIYVPNAFTPNADTRNEQLYVRANNLTELYFAIYDRWGEKVFETESTEKGWNGTFRGRDVDPAVYVYYLRAVCEGGEEYFEEGNITVIR